VAKNFYCNIVSYHLIRNIKQMKDRRKFLKELTLCAMATSLSPIRLSAKNTIGCSPTSSDILGPFFSEGAPQTNLLIPEDYQGARLFLSGRILSDDCVTPINEAVLNFWQANENGEYDNEGFNFRAKILSDLTGNYSLDTIIPGKYENGSVFRPAHIHLKVQAEGFNELVTQIYFQGDIDISADPWASSESALQRIIPLYEESLGDWHGSFDVVLSNHNGIGLNEIHKNHGDLTQNFPNPFSIKTNFSFVLNFDTHAKIEVFDSLGSRVKIILNQNMPKGRYQFCWDASGLVNGVYTAVWTSGKTQIKSIKMIKQIN
jgi:protocatechuate 3,4-dioxygenase beta subunit